MTFRDADRESVLDEITTHETTWTEWSAHAAAELRRERTRQNMIAYYRQWNGRYRAALANSPLHGPHRR